MITTADTTKKSVTILLNGIFINQISPIHVANLIHKRYISNMIDELKIEIEKTFNRKIEDRGDCEALAQDIYEKTGAVLSYNTLRRLFGLAEYRKPRESTLDHLGIYCGFRSFKDFTQRFTEVDTWPTWEGLYVTLSLDDPNELIEVLRYRKRRQEQFTLSFTIVVRELLNRKDLHGLLLLFRDPSFQFEHLPYDEVAQIGVLVGLHFRNFDDFELEQKLLQEPNFRDLVFKIFVDYGRLNAKYGNWVRYLSSLDSLDPETKTFISCIEIWRRMLALEPISASMLKEIPVLSMAQHPILFGRIFGIQMCVSSSKSGRIQLIELMELRLAQEPHFATELLYEPAVQSIVTSNIELSVFVASKQHLINDIKYWYHFSQVSIHRVFQTSLLIKEKQFIKAQNILHNIPYGHIRHGYREFIELYVSFFRWKIANALGSKEQQELQANFIERRQKLNYPLFTDAYFEHYFDD